MVVYLSILIYVNKTRNVNETHFNLLHVHVVIAKNKTSPIPIKLLQNTVLMELQLYIFSNQQQQQQSLFVPRNCTVLHKFKKEKLPRKRAQPLRNSKLIELSGWAKRKNLQIPTLK